MAGTDPTHVHRRGFFRNALRQAIAPVVDYFEQPAPRRVPEQPPRILLRPPGAIPEDRFLDTCRRCGECVAICPANAIFPSTEDGPDRGMPVIDADVAACVVCDGLQCTHVCPSGALLPLALPHEIRMGLAEVYPTLCVRSNGDPCTLCVDLCPIGSAAIRFDDHGPPTVLRDGCVGCGVCQLHCPTSPKAIVVVPVDSGRAVRAS